MRCKLNFRELGIYILIFCTEILYGSRHTPNRHKRDRISAGAELKEPEAQLPEVNDDNDMEEYDIEALDEKTLHKMMEVIVMHNPLFIDRLLDIILFDLNFPSHCLKAHLSLLELLSSCY